MTLERLTERLQEEKDKIGKVDGRRFNARSRTKESWQMKNIEKSIAVSERKRTHRANRSTFTKEELQEYKEIEDKLKAERIEDKLNQLETPPGSPPTKRTRCTPTTPPCTPTRSTSSPCAPRCASRTPSSPSTRRKYTA